MKFEPRIRDIDPSIQGAASSWKVADLSRDQLSILSEENLLKLEKFRVPEHILAWSLELHIERKREGKLRPLGHKKTLPRRARFGGFRNT